MAHLPGGRMSSSADWRWHQDNWRLVDNRQKGLAATIWLRVNADIVLFIKRWDWNWHFDGNRRITLADSLFDHCISMALSLAHKPLEGSLQPLAIDGHGATCCSNDVLSLHSSDWRLCRLRLRHQLSIKPGRQRLISLTGS